MAKERSSNASQSYFIWLFTTIVGLVGVVLLFLAGGIDEKLVWHHLVRDVGVAFVVASIVTIAFEVHARSRYEKESIEGVLNTVMGVNVPAEVWQEVQSVVINRDVIRELFEIRLSLLKNTLLPEGQGELFVYYGYDLYGLLPRKGQTAMNHELDYQMQNKAANLPRFDLIRVGDKVFKNKQLAGIVKKGVATINVKPERKGGKPIRIVTERHEISSMPGSYTLVMTELTLRFNLLIEELPPGIKAEVKVRANKAEAKLKQVDSSWEYDGVLLPGQSIEIKFLQENI